MVTIGYILFLAGTGLALYLGYIEVEWVIVIFPIVFMAVGGMLMQTKDGKLYNLYYRESKGLESHPKGILYLGRIFAMSLIIPHGILALILFFLAKLVS